MNVSYEGLPVDLTGLKVLVRYDGTPTNNKTVYAKDAGFLTYPAKAVGVLGILKQTDGSGGDYDGKTVWLPMRNYILFLNTPNGLLKADLTIPGVEPISRSESWTTVKKDADTKLYVSADAPGLGDDEFKWAKGLRLVGIGDDVKEIFVDDYPNLNGYKMEADYANGDYQTITLDPTTDWKLLPRYDNPKGEQYTGRGDIFVTIGKNPVITGKETAKAQLDQQAQAAFPDTTADDYVATTLNDADGTAHEYDIDFPTAAQLAKLPGNSVDAGLTMRRPFDKVFHVMSVKVEGNPDLGKFLYFEGDTSEDWRDRLIDAKAEITVTYSDGANPPTKTLPVETFTQMNKVWKNPTNWNDDQFFGALGVKGLLATQGGETLNTRIKTYIELNYRGAWTRIEVPVYTRLQKIDPVINSAEETVQADMRRTDNDIPGMNAKRFSKLITVTATFLGSGAYGGSEYFAEREIFFDEDNFQSDSTTGVPEAKKELLYTMDFGEHDKLVSGDWDGEGWGMCNEPANNAKDGRRVTIYYATPAREAYGVAADSSVRQGRVPTYFTNIHIK